MATLLKGELMMISVDEPENDHKESGKNSKRHQEILEVAVAVFAAKGFASATVRDIADAAGILSGSLYHHFRSKTDILSQIMEDFLTRLVERISTIEKESTSPRECMERFILDAFATIQAEPLAVTLYQNEAPAMAERPGFEFLSAGRVQIEEMWMQALAQGIRDGYFRPDLDKRLAYRFIRDGMWSVVHWYRPGGHYDIDTIAKQYLAMLEAGVLLQD